MRVVPRKLRLENFSAIQLGPRGTFIGIARKLSRLLSQCRGLGGSTLVHCTGLGCSNGTERSTVVGRSNGTGRSSTILQYSLQQGVVQFSSAVQGWVVTTFYPVEIETFRFSYWVKRT